MQFDTVLDKKPAGGYDATICISGGKGMEKLRRILNRETILYLVFGVATTVVNYLVFWLIYDVAFDRENSLTANTIAFAAAVVFAFIVNKMYVFESRSWSMDALKKEVPPFLASRIGSFLIEEAGLFLCEGVLKLNGVVLFNMMGLEVDAITVAKLGLSVVVVLLNYVFCKFFVFRK